MKLTQYAPHLLLLFVIFVLVPSVLKKDYKENYANWGHRFGPHCPMYSDFNLLLPHPSYEVSDPGDFSISGEFRNETLYRDLNQPNGFGYKRLYKYKNNQNGVCLNGADGEYDVWGRIHPKQFFRVKNRVGYPLYNNNLLELPTVTDKHQAVGIQYNNTHPCVK